jgi:hypothetical protein
MKKGWRQIGERIKSSTEEIQKGRSFDSFSQHKEIADKT